LSGQNWSNNNLGGYLANPVLSKQVRHAASLIMKFRQFVRPEPGYGKGKSDRILIDRVTQVQVAGGSISELSRIPETNVQLSQIAVIVNEYGNSIPFTGKLDDLAEYSVDNIWARALRDDMAETLDKQCGTQFQAAQVKYEPTGTSALPTSNFDTGGTPTQAATRNLQGFDIQQVVTYLRSTLKAHPYDGENFICICPPDLVNALLQDTNIRNDFRYGDPQRIFIGEMGRWFKTRFIEENNLLTATLGSTAYNAQAVVFGDDPVVEAVAVPGEIRAKIPEDYGRSKGLAWYALLGFSIVWNTSTARQANIVHMTST
jgi:N4-gp56 family major capsid protein